MPIQFPSNATNGQTHQTGGQTWLYDGTAWSVIPAGATGATGATGTSANLLAVVSNIVPAANVTYDLGISTLRWRDLYLSGDSFYLGGAVIKASNNAVVLPAGSLIGNAAIGSGGATVTVSNTVPATTSQGSLWFDADTGDLSVYASGGWAGVGTGPIGATGAVGATGAAGSQGATGAAGTAATTGKIVAMTIVFGG